MPHVTLSICMYNAAQTIEKTLESVLAQTMQDFHLLMVDDGSTDDSVERAEAFFKQPPQRSYELLRLSENRGIAHARNLALHHASTPYMVFLDADDLLLPQALEKLLHRIAADPDLMAVGCYLEHIDAEGVRMGSGSYIGATSKEEFMEKARMGKLMFMSPLSIFRRDVALRVGGYEVEGFPEGGARYQDNGEDLSLWTRMSDLYTEGKAIVVIPEVLYQYRKAGGSLSYRMVHSFLRMRHIKLNLRRRRSGQAQLSFTQFYGELRPEELKSVERDANAVAAVRTGVLHLRRFHVFRGLWYLVVSLWYRPGYLVEKARTASGHRMIRRLLHIGNMSAIHKQQVII